MRLVAIVFLLSFFNSHLYAQSWSGMNQSNYNGANAFYSNTAMAVSSPFMVSVNGFSMGMNFENNYLTYKLPFSMTQWVRGTVPSQYKDSRGRVKFQNEWFEENLDGNPKNFDFNIENRGPASMYNYDRRFAVGFFSRTRIGLQGFGMSEEVARIFRYGLDSTQNFIYNPPNEIKFGDEISDNSFSINLNSFSEIGIGGAAALIHNKYMTVSVGANIKYLLGMGTGYVKNNGTSFKVNGFDSVSFGKTDIEYGYVQPSFYSNLNTINFMNGKPAGSGFGFDLSAYMELKKPNHRIGSYVEIPDVEYYFRGGIALQDMGSITYNTGVIARHLQNTTPKTWTPGIEFAQAWSTGMEGGLHYMDSLTKAMFQVTESNTIKATLPTTLMLHGDLKIISKFYIGAQISQSLRGKQSVSYRKPSSLTLVPRFEMKGVEVAVPMSLYNDYRNANIGAFLRLGPFFFGTDNIITSISRSSFKGFNYYFGLSYGFGNSKIDDRH
ncbi:MAG: hypothetical protein LC109_11260 [Bacteroidia bacterium]|nr:hypothetical protein [Bacteroidota bacterium]MCZ2130828.1 hypothetical protein [Bacteroidia bacterium]